MEPPEVSPAPFTGQMTPVRIPTPYFFEIHLIFSFNPRVCASDIIFSSGFPTTIVLAFIVATSW
jgi:hypothetical protein